MAKTTFSGPVYSDNGFVGSITLPTDITGDTITATVGFVGDVTGNVTGDVTGNVTGDVTGNVTGDLSGNVTGNITGDVTGAVAYGTSGSPISVSTAQNVNTGYVTTSAASGDTRLTYNKLTFTAAGSGETFRAYSVVTGTGAAAGGTINGAHISMKVDTGGTISGAANALRATLGSAVNSPGGTLAAIQVDTDFSAGTTLPSTASFIRFTESGTAKMANLFNVPTAMVENKTGSNSHVLKIVAASGAAYYIMLSDSVS